MTRSFLRRSLFAALLAPFALSLALLPGPWLSRAASAETTTTSLAPVLAAPEGWLAAVPSSQSIAGKVVVVDIFTFGCGNCQNVVPNLRRLDARRSEGVVVLGVHSPETPYEHERSNVVASLRSQGISWPVALDNAFTIWKAYDVQAWPTQLIFDRHGKLRRTVVGDSQDVDVDATVATLLAEK